MVDVPPARDWVRAYNDLRKQLELLDQANRTLSAQNTGLGEDVERLRAFIGRVVGAYAVDEWIAQEGQRLLDDKA
jgi:hypothetical protein